MTISMISFIISFWGEFLGHHLIHSVEVRNLVFIHRVEFPGLLLLPMLLRCAMLFVVEWLIGDFNHLLSSP
jgi:hypothetical protein